MIAPVLQNGLSDAGVQLPGGPSARVQEYYAVSVQTCLCARVGEAGLIRAIVSSRLRKPHLLYANPQAYRNHPRLARRSCLRFRSGQQERPLYGFASGAGKHCSGRGEHCRRGGPSPARLLADGALPDGCSFCCGACHRCQYSARCFIEGPRPSLADPKLHRREALGGT